MALSLITFTAGTVIKSADVNQNFSDINSRLFAINNENVAPAAGIVDTKLATIATANKVDGSSLINESIDAVKGQFFWGLGGTQVMATNVSFEYEPTANLTIVGIELRAKDGPTGDDLIIDINKNGTTIFGTKPQINDGAVVDAGVATITTTDLAPGDVLTVDIDQIGSTIAGADISVILAVEQKIPQ